MGAIREGGNHTSSHSLIRTAGFTQAEPQAVRSTQQHEYGLASVSQIEKLIAQIRFIVARIPFHSIVARHKGASMVKPSPRVVVDFFGLSFSRSSSHRRCTIVGFAARLDLTLGLVIR